VDFLTLAVFVLVAVGTAAAAVRQWRWRTRVLARLGQRRPEARLRIPAIPSAASAWKELLERIGTTVPASPKSLPQLRRRLIRAGYRIPGAAKLFEGTRAAGAVLLGGAALALAWRAGVSADRLVLVTAAGVMTGYVAPGQALAWRIARRKHAIEKGLPNALDLMVVCVESGLGIDQAMVQVSRELMRSHPDICDEFAVVNLELRAGKPRAEALHNLAERSGVDDLRKLVAVLVQTDRFGTSIAQTLRGHSDYLRAMARQRAEERAAKLAVKLVFPIFFCVLPSLFIVTVGPVLVRLVRDLFPMIENM
jgi:tight adherence protein C